MKRTELVALQIAPASHLVVELVEPDGEPARCVVTWPLAQCVISPDNFKDLAQALVKLFSGAHVALTRIRARRKGA